MRKELARRWTRVQKYREQKREGHWRKVLKTYSKSRLRNQLVKQKGNTFLCIRKEQREKLEVLE